MLIRIDSPRAQTTLLVAIQELGASDEQIRRVRRAVPGETIKLDAPRKCELLDWLRADADVCEAQLVAATAEDYRALLYQRLGTIALLTAQLTGVRELA